MEEKDKQNINTFTLGVAVGVQLMQNKIKNNCEQGKPIMVDGELYFLTDSKKHLKEVIEHYNNAMTNNDTL
jgi:hypothetical protein